MIPVHAMRLGILSLLAASSLLACGSESDDFRMVVDLAPNSCQFCGGGFPASRVSYELLDNAAGVVERGDLTAIEDDLGGTSVWGLITELPPTGDYRVNLTAFGDGSRCRGTGRFSVPPSYRGVLFGCGELVRTPEDFERLEYVTVINGTVEEQ